MHKIGIFTRENKIKLWFYLSIKCCICGSSDIKMSFVTDKKQRNNVNKVCFNTFFFGENINWEEVLT